MAWKASQTRIVKPKYLIIAIALSASMPYFVVLGNWTATNGNNKVMRACLDLEDIEMSKILLFSNVFLSFICIGSGLFFDVKMLMFVKNQNKTQPIQLVPWKSVNPQEQTKVDSIVPLRATCISSAFLIFFAIFSPIYVALVNQMGELFIIFL